MMMMMMDSVWQHTASNDRTPWLTCCEDEPSLIQFHRFILEPRVERQLDPDTAKPTSQYAAVCLTAVLAVLSSVGR